MQVSRVVHFYRVCTHLLSKNLNVKIPYYTSTFSSEHLVAFLDVHTREIDYLSLMYVVYTNASNSTSSYTHINLYMVWKVHPRAH